jgi:hypothetical protein
VEPQAAVGVAVVGGLNDDDLAAWVAASCERHRVPTKVTDAAVVVRVAALLSGGAARPGASAAGRTGAPDSEPPNGVDALGVETLGAAPAGADHGVVEDSGDDGVLASEVEVPPPLP